MFRRSPRSCAIERPSTSRGLVPLGREELTDPRENPVQSCNAAPASVNRLTESSQCVTMSHMKEISIRELHRDTGAWVRSARQYGSILVRDRNTPVAVIAPVTEAPAVNLFDRWKPLRKLAAALDRPVGGTPVEDIVGRDRDR